MRGPRLRCGCVAAGRGAFLPARCSRRLGAGCLPARSSLAPLRGVVCDVGTILPRTVTSPPRTVTSQPANGGNCSIRGATRRRHAEARLLMVQNPHHCPWCHAPQLLQDCPARRWLNALARHLQSKAIQARGRAQIRTIKGSSGRVEVFQMDGVGISIIERPRPLHNHDTPNLAQHLLHPHMRRDPIGIVVASPASPRRRCVWTGGHDRPREGAADPRYCCVWTGVQGMSHWRCTRYVALHPNRRGGPVRKPLAGRASGVPGTTWILPRAWCTWAGSKTATTGTT